MKCKHSDTAVLLNDVRKHEADLPKHKYNEVLLIKIKELGAWIWTHKWLITSLLIVSVNISMHFMLRKYNKNSILRNNAKIYRFQFLDVKLTVDEYITLKTFCEYVYCSSDLCYCIPHTSENWFSAKKSCQFNLKNGSLAMKVSNSILETTINHGQVNMYYESNRLGNLCLGAFVNFEGKSFWINNESFKDYTVSVDHCVVKNGKHFQRTSCNLRISFIDFICKSSHASCETPECPLIATQGSTHYCETQLLSELPIHHLIHLTLIDLRKVCIRDCLNSELLYFESSEEIDFVLNNINGLFFIGATDYLEFGNWKWIGGMSGINFGKVPQFVDRNITNGYFIRFNNGFSIHIGGVTISQRYLCQFPNEFSKDGIIPISFLYSKMGAPKCQHLSCSKNFGKCYCFIERTDQNLDCDSFSEWEFLTIYDEEELNYVQNTLKLDEFGWKLGANNFIERSIFQWADTRGMKNTSVVANKDKYSCLTLSRSGLQQLPCEKAVRCVCTLMYSKLERN